MNNIIFNDGNYNIDSNGNCVDKEVAVFSEIRKKDIEELIKLNGNSRKESDKPVEDDYRRLNDVLEIMLPLTGYNIEDSSKDFMVVRDKENEEKHKIKIKDIKERKVNDKAHFKVYFNTSDFEKYVSENMFYGIAQNKQAIFKSIKYDEESELVVMHFIIPFEDEGFNKDLYGNTMFCEHADCNMTRLSTKQIQRSGVKKIFYDLGVSLYGTYGDVFYNSKHNHNMSLHITADKLRELADKIGDSGYIDF